MKKLTKKIMENYLAVDKLREDGMNLLEKYSNLFDQDHNEIFKGLLRTETTIDIESETFGGDVGYYLNLIIEVLTSYEDRMSKEDREEFDDICTKSLSLYELSKYHIGKLIIHNELPYRVMDIDFDDVSLLLGNGEIEEFWICINEL
jgi:hypothetical protein